MNLRHLRSGISYILHDLLILWLPTAPKEDYSLHMLYPCKWDIMSSNNMICYSSHLNIKHLMIIWAYFGTLIYVGSLGARYQIEEFLLGSNESILVQFVEHTSMLILIANLELPWHFCVTTEFYHLSI